MPCNHRTKCRHLADSFHSACSRPLEMQHKKWFRVIRVATPLLASMLGIERCGARETGGRLVMLAAVSSGAAGLDWGGPLPVSPVRSRHLKAGFSLAPDDGRRATVMGSLFPTCFFNVSLDRPSRSVRRATPR